MRRKRSLNRRTLAALVGIAVLTGLLGAGIGLARGGGETIPPSVAIEGVAVGGLTIEEAEDLLEGTVSEAAAQTVVLSGAEQEIEVSWAELGLEANVEQAIAEARGARGAISRLFARLGLNETVEIPLSYRLDPQTVAVFAETLERQLTRAPRSAQLALTSGRVILIPASEGRALDTEALRDALLALERRIALPLATLEPAIPTEAAQTAKAIAAKLLTDPPTIVHREASFRPSAGLIASALSLEANGRGYDVSLRPKLLAGPLQRAFADYRRPSRNARFAVDGETVSVLAGAAGRDVAVNQTVAAILRHFDAERIKARFRRVEPKRTTAEAKAMRIREPIAEFTTPYTCCPPRVTNIQRAAQILDGQVIEAGATFSLNEALGRRTRKRGFVPAPMIDGEGRLVDAVGGGVSQVATTVFNAAFFAGLELIQHTPHTFYISRYPMGREATVSWGGPELVFRNDWPAAILITAFADTNGITIRFYSSLLDRRIETETGEPYDQKAATIRTVTNPALPPGTQVVVQQGGIPGFRVDYTRRVYKGEQLRRDERTTVTYEPEDTFVEVGPST